MKKLTVSRRAVLILLAALLFFSLGLNVYLLFFAQTSYLQDVDEIYIMESGILQTCLEFAPGEDIHITYDFDAPEYAQLVQEYHIDSIAGEGSEFQQALNLMHEFAPGLRHKSDYDNHISMDALSLLSYSLGNRSHGINCRSKAQILNEMCLALGIYSRKVWINPSSPYDGDCHVVNEVWDSTLQKWVMLDITNDQYWIDENGTPLSILEIREKGAAQGFCTPVNAGEDISQPEKLLERHKSEFLYIMKNLVYMTYCGSYGVGESEDLWLLFPKGLDTSYEFLISEEACLLVPNNE